MKRILIVGAGAAGLAAAYAAALADACVLVLEKNEKAGKKIYITGKGRCNFTNSCETDAFFSSVYRNSAFANSSVRAFDSEDLISLLESAGLKAKIERGQRVFPASDKASDVTKAWMRLTESLGVQFRFNTTVRELVLKDGRVTGVVTDMETIEADGVVLACGGLSYPVTGSTGDGYRMAEFAGHSIQTVSPALTPLNSHEKWVHSLSGLSLKNIQAVLKDINGKIIASEFGEMLFTHKGVSGPAVLTLSCLMGDMKNCVMEIDLKPALDENTLDKRLIRDFSASPNKTAKNCLDALAPRSLAKVLFNKSGIKADKPIHQITSGERMVLIGLLKGLRLSISSKGGFEEAIITDGGINVREVNPKTMASKRVQGLFIAGEMLNVHGFTGGFNLQLAFSTGIAAGRGATGN